MATITKKIKEYTNALEQEKKSIDKENRVIKKVIKSDIYQVMDTRSYEWKLAENSRRKREISSTIRKLKKVV